MPKISINTINDRFIKTLEVHKIYWDSKTTGFGVRITKSGKVSFVLRYIVNRRERKYTIGDYPTHSALSARETAIKLNGEAAKGFDPTFASILANNGIGELLGHSNSRTTERYSHLHNNTLRNASELVGGVVMGK